jgi:hypothetical protein
MPYRLYLYLTHSITSPPMLMQHMHQPWSTNDRSTSYHHMTLLVHRWSWPQLLLTIAFISWLLPSSISAKSLLKLPRHAVYCLKVSDLPFTLATNPSSQVLSQSSPPSYMTPCHVSYAMSSIITCVSFVIYPSHFELHGLCCLDKCSCGLNHLCIPLKHILVHLWLPLNYQNQTRDLSPCQL